MHGSVSNMNVQPDTLRSLSARVAKRNYQKYLLEVPLRNVRAFKRSEDHIFVPGKPQ